MMLTYSQILICIAEDIERFFEPDCRAFFQALLANFSLKSILANSSHDVG